MEQFESNFELSDVQERAIDLLLAGESSVDTAAKLGIGRATLQRWKSNPAFAAELRRRRAELRDAARAKLLKIVDAAILAIFDEMRNGNAKIALSLLEGLGILGEAAAKEEAAEIVAEVMENRDGLG